MSMGYRNTSHELAFHDDDDEDDIERPLHAAVLCVKRRVPPCYDWEDAAS